MPKDSNLLAPHSQELLRAARSGRLYKRQAPLDDEDHDHDHDETAEKPEKKEEESTEKGFPIKVWKQVPRNVDAGELSHLAKRRKNTITIASKTVEDRIPGVMVTKATVRRTDAAGNPYTEEITLTAGQAVDGEIISTRVVEASAAPRLHAHQAAQRQKKPVAQKRKAKAGPGRGKKKNRDPVPGQVPVQPGAVAGATDANGGAVGADVSNTHISVLFAVRANYLQGQPVAQNAGANQDSEMADGDGHDDDDDDDDEDGDEGDDKHDDSEMLDSTLDVTKELDSATDTNMSEGATGPATPNIEMTDVPEKATSPPREAPTSVPSFAHLDSDASKAEGSPLKNVILPPTETLPLDPIRLGADIGVAAEVGSTVAEPPSTIAGEEPEPAANRDLTLQATEEEALLPPPHEQVGNIASPKASSEEDDKTKDSQSGEASFQDKAHSQHDIIMAEDTIKPEDSASVRFPLSESGAPSEVGTGSVNGGESGNPATGPEKSQQTEPEAGDMEVDPKPAAAAPMSLADILSKSEDTPQPSVTGSTVAQVASPRPEPETLPEPEPEPEREPEVAAEAQPEPEEEAAQPEPAPPIEAAVEPAPEAVPEPAHEPAHEPAPALEPAPEPEIRPAEPAPVERAPAPMSVNALLSSPPPETAPAAVEEPPREPEPERAPEPAAEHETPVEAAPPAHEEPASVAAPAEPEETRPSGPEPVHEEKKDEA